jgi:hypothetical protein
MPTPAQLRSDLLLLTNLAGSDLEELWRQVSDAVEARDALMDVLPALIETYGEAAASVAADWYDDLRDEDEIRGRFTAVVPDAASAGGESLAGWAMEPYLDLDEFDWGAAKSRVAGGMQRCITDSARRVITLSSVEDPQADGWQRVARSNGCYFCRMLAGRGAVYTEDTADFSSHDGCHCTAAVAWSGREKPIKAYTPSRRNSTEADRQRTYAWLRDNADTL